MWPDQEYQAVVVAFEKQKAETDRLRAALASIKARAFSDAPVEELEDAQRDLRHIYATADCAIAQLKD